MNHRNAIPANGMSSDATLNRVLPASSHWEPGAAPSGSALRIRKIARPNSTAPGFRSGLAGQQPDHQSVGLGQQVVLGVAQFGVDESLAALGFPDPAAR